MEEYKKKEMAFYLLIGCAVLSIVVAYKMKSIIYLLLAAAFGIGAVYAWRSYQAAKKAAAEQPAQRRE